MSQERNETANAVIGKPVDRIDGRVKVTGGARYSAEIKLPERSAHAVLVNSTIARGRISRIDSAPAERAAGVLAVITHLNAPRLARATQRPAGESTPVLQSPEIFYHGQHVACVVAETLEAAEHAATLVKIEYQTAKAAIDSDAPGNQTLMPKLRFGTSGPPIQTARGDFKQGLANAQVRVEQTYTVGNEHHNPMEPHATTAVWEGDNLMVYDATQGVSNVQQYLAGVFNLDRTKVRVVMEYVGGGFGGKGSPWTHTVICAIAARHVKRPVKLVLARRQMFATVGHRARNIQKLQLGATRDGELVALRHETTNHISMLDEFVEPCGLFTQMMYSCRNTETAHRLVRLNVPTPIFTRAPGEAPGSFAAESAMDEMAYALDLDPIEFRNRNYAETDEEAGHPFSSKSLRECYRLGAEKFGWGRRKPQPRQTRDGRWLVGYGTATATYPANFGAASAYAKIEADGRITVRCGTQDLGTGMYTIGTQIAAETLRVPMERVKFEIGDTRFPPAPGSGGSRSTASAGSAVLAACTALRARLIEFAINNEPSPLAGLAPDELMIENGRIFAKNNPSRGETYVEILRRQNLRRVELTAGAAPGKEREPENPPLGSRGDETEGNSKNQIYAFDSFGAHFCEVRVDEELGIVRVARFVGAYGCGRIMNLKTATSQIKGGVIWGIGMALHEESHLDRRYGQFANHSLAEYHLPVHLDIPEIEVHFVEEKDEFVNPLGVKGVGEIGIVGAAAAIANAIFNATGKRVRDLPITPDKLL